MLGLFKKLFKKRTSDSVSKRDFIAAIHAIIGAYGSVLEERVARPCFVADESKLPHRKEIIKNAIITALKHNLYPSNFKKHLKISFLELCMWQKDIGLKDRRHTIDVSSLNINDSIENLASQITNQNPDEKLAQVVSNERESLKRELQECGLW